MPPETIPRFGLNLLDHRERRMRSWRSRVAAALVTWGIAILVGTVLVPDHAKPLLIVGIAGFLLIKLIPQKPFGMGDLLEEYDPCLDDRPPILILRSFHQPDLKTSPTRYHIPMPDPSGLMEVEYPCASIGGATGYGHGGGDPPVRVPGKPLAEVVAYALKTVGPVVTFEREFGSGAYYRDSIMIVLRASSENWIQPFQLLADAAQCIILLPGTTRGLAIEINELRVSSRLGKTLVLMPPTPEYGFLMSLFVLTDDADKYRQAWHMLQQFGETMGCSFPDYEPSGLIYLPNPDFSIREAHRLQGMLSPTTVQTAVARLCPDSRTQGRSLSSIAPSLALEVWTS